MKTPTGATTMTLARLTTAVMLATLPVLSAPAQEVDAEESDPNEVTIGQTGSEQDPLSGRDTGLAIEPEEVTDPLHVDPKQSVPAMRVRVDPRVLGVAPGEPLPPLRREGEALRKRDGQLLPTGERGYAVFIMDADPEAGDDKPLAMVVAPCKTLESMERLLEDRGDNLRFTMTGQVHTYRGVNYLLPTSQPKPWLIDADAQERLVTEPGEGTETPADPETPQDDQAAPEGAAEQEATPSADDVLQELLNLKRDSPTPDSTESTDASDDASLTPAPPQPRVPSDPLLLGLDTDQPLAELKEEGQFIIARTGRLIRSADGSHALFVLDADGPGAPEPPMILQACKLLETMEKTVQQQGENVPFIITGQVFMYRGANYLLPTIVNREFDRGNLE
ncbi:MAG: hypothetical protein KTR15_02285 [Phycisphaeraceae bacterium]|nr:hypothetical protein [Phycisphaeraceae bacterium]